MKLFRYRVPSRYIPDRFSPHQGQLSTGYLLIEYIEPARELMLSDTWDVKRMDPDHRANLFRGLSRIFLALARIPLPRIGSFIIDNDGFVRLENRPLSLEIQQLENEGIDVDIPRGFTYSTVDSYVLDILSMHDSRLRQQPNAVNDIGDSIFQMSALATMRTVQPLFLRRDLRRGPFIFSLTDLHQSNILVDDDWNITCIIDLEWAFSRPVEMLQPPRLLSNEAADTIVVAEYDKLRMEFMAVLNNEAKHFGSEQIANVPNVMEVSWQNGTFRYVLALRSPTALFRVFYDHIQKYLAERHEEDDDFYRITQWYWTKNPAEFIDQKVKDKAEYDIRLRAAFEETEA